MMKQVYRLTWMLAAEVVVSLALIIGLTMIITQ
jgi:hypothetical protein